MKTISKMVEALENEIQMVAFLTEVNFKAIM